MRNLIITLLFLMSFGSFAQKPIVWIYTDMSDNTLPGNNHMGTINDPDDVSAMAGYLLMANEFDTRKVVITSTHRKEHKSTPDQEKWVNDFFGKAYKKDVKNLNKEIGGFPKKIDYVQSCIKESGERFDPNKKYESLKNYSTVKMLFDAVEAEDDVFNVLCWGSLTEPAILVKHCETNKRLDLLTKLRFIAHWTNSPLHQGSTEYPENVANCREDAKACAFLKEMAANEKIKYYECGAIGQHGIVSGSQKGVEYFNQFKTSQLGTIFREGKYVHNCVDHSDAATYWVLLGKWGVSLKDINSDGSNSVEIETANEKKFVKSSHRIHDELLRRSKIAAGL